MSKIMIRTLSDFADSHASWQKEQFVESTNLICGGFFFDIRMFFCSFAVCKLQRVIIKRKQNGKD